jgi:hypothetical protein
VCDVLHQCQASVRKCSRQLQLRGNPIIGKVLNAARELPSLGSNDSRITEIVQASQGLLNSSSAGVPRLQGTEFLFHMLG